MQKNLQNERNTNADNQYLSYQNMFWLFMIGNLVGFVMEGIFCFFKYGEWESHVVTIWGPFCLIYGIGFVLFYAGAVLLANKNIFVKFVAIGMLASAIELLCGLLLEFGMGMRAWSYRKHFLNIRGHISLKMTFAWGLMGVAFAYIAVPLLKRLFRLTKGKASKILCAVLSVFMFINLTATLGCMVRWKQRLDDTPARTGIGRTIDRFYDNERMSRRFIEWRPINPQDPPDLNPDLDEDILL